LNTSRNVIIPQKVAAGRIDQAQCGRKIYYDLMCGVLHQHIEKRTTHGSVPSLAWRTQSWQKSPLFCAPQQLLVAERQ
jgi:hypothetical protein